MLELGEFDIWDEDGGANFKDDKLARFKLEINPKTWNGETKEFLWACDHDCSSIA
ncbi:MAG: hypothetical protein GY737_14475 [Desulfobacteraceae bacterium]|nr:hypothetical protein [Desulfobacteraceae bacterium]